MINREKELEGLRLFLRKQECVVNNGERFVLDQEKRNLLKDLYGNDEFIVIPQKIYSLILEAQARRDNAKHRSDYNPVILSTIDDNINPHIGRSSVINSPFINYIKTLSQYCDEGKRYRLDLISQTFVHATAISLFISKNTIQCIYIDPSQDRSNFSYLVEGMKGEEKEVILRNNIYQEIEMGSGPSVQNDRNSCFAFAASYLRKMHKMEEEQLAKIPEDCTDYTVLHPSFLRYAQTTKILNDDYCKNLNFSMTGNLGFDELKRRQFIETKDGRRNIGIELFKLRNLRYALALFENSTDEEIQAIYERRVTKQKYIESEQSANKKAMEKELDCNSMFFPPKEECEYNKHIVITAKDMDKALLKNFVGTLASCGKGVIEKVGSVYIYRHNMFDEKLNKIATDFCSNNNITFEASETYFGLHVQSYKTAQYDRNLIIDAMLD